ncbi:eukaryotic translation initiation factor 3 subunit A-like isoform X2 [Neocloeon triangulifer]|uniref:eukaryotic translation initiation factor 3 subunit A-like isoform X2 n=1 Tax=Neocloeon triangulifer TaxID=2078957 RepID=UPI00286EBB29|nr:eukaryotic translation initiation factor 3 subunit A-like isoform X2 [Neocloeon triangulifer]
MIEPEPEPENAISEEERLAREAILTEKMAKMREKNEAIRKRYNEVQEDLKNAQAISSQVKVESGSGDDDEDNKPIRKVVNKTPPREKDRESKRFTPRRQNSEPNAEGTEQAVPARFVHSFGDGGGPPPDPGYNFLADEERDGPKDNKDQKEKAANKNNSSFSGRGGSFKQQQRGRFPRQRGGQRGNRQYQGDDVGRPQREGGGVQDKDQKWREERAAIDEARIRRQQNSDGNWRREWDNEKSDEQEQPPTHTPNQFRGGRGRRGGPGERGGFRDQGQPRGNGTKFFYQQRGRGNYQSQGENRENNFQAGDRWVRDTSAGHQGHGAHPEGAPVRDLRDVLSSRRTGGTGRVAIEGNHFDHQPKPRRENRAQGSSRHAADDDEWEDVE